MFRNGFIIWLLAPVVALAQPHPDWKVVGQLKTRDAKEIKSSNWSIGCETMDRTYTRYENWKAYLSPLGFKKARLQGGWARTERRKGVYDWAWLDSIVFDMPKRGVEPWIGLGYGNAVYAEGGGTTLFGALPASEEALAAWDRWVTAMVSRYGSVVDEWEVWNEPNYRIPAEAYARFLIRTAERIKAVQPKGRVLAFALGSGVDYRYADQVLGRVAAAGKLGLIDEVTFHRHHFVPEAYEAVEQLREVVRRYDPRITLRQGESGAPTSRRATKALNNYDWSERTATKWALRRLLGDLGRDIPSNYFGIMDMKYPDEMNTKGLLRSRDDQTVERPKQAYAALQYLAAVFDDQWKRRPGFTGQTGTDSVTVFGYQHVATRASLVTLWKGGRIPAEQFVPRDTDFTFAGTTFREPVYVDLISGKVYQIPNQLWQQRGKNAIFMGVPLPDYPVLIAERAALPLIGTQGRRTASQ